MDWKRIIYTTMSEASGKANGMVSAKWINDKEGSFASNYFIFLKIFFSV